MQKRYAFFDFNTSGKMASNRGKCRGMINTESGEISAVITYGLMNYREEYHLKVGDPVHAFPYTDEDFMILHAQESLRKSGLAPCANVERRTKEYAT